MISMVVYVNIKLTTNRCSTLVDATFDGLTRQCGYATE